MKTTAASTRTLLWGAIVALASSAAPHPVAAETTLLRCGTLIDGVSDAGREDVAIRIEDDRIAFSADRDDDERAGSAARFIEALSGEASIMARCTGKTDVHNLEPEDLRAITPTTARAVAIPLAGTTAPPED